MFDGGNACELLAVVLHSFDLKCELIFIKVNVIDKEDLIKHITEKSMLSVFIDQADSGLGVELYNDLIIYLTELL